ncbi:hypothetical protein NQ317_016659 [Molorchus minor]|uniref:THAP-type domain-containing protein n=1 Tax=Molorchus minor TaxID=1323400 RepID=A0ABQ9JP32_9CUCU|nr:hypothetical protein NQ317_016659 [Molorchus minor]
MAYRQSNRQYGAEGKLMVRYRSCSVMGCEDKFSSRHRFPNPANNLDLFQKWVLACGNEELINMPPEQIFRTKRVCHIHFKECDIGSNMLLNRGIVPSLFLPTITDEPRSTLATDNVVLILFRS